MNMARTYDQLGFCDDPSCPCQENKRLWYRPQPPSNGKPGVGGAPSRATTLPTDSTERKGYPIATGFMDYFPDAIVAISRLSHLANEQHSPGQPVHWARSKSTDEDNTLMRHFLQRGTKDIDGTSHTAKMAWRALAILQKEIEGEGK